MASKLLNMSEDAFDHFRGSDWILQRNVVGNSIQVAQRRL